MGLGGEAGEEIASSECVSQWSADTLVRLLVEANDSFDEFAF